MDGGASIAYSETGPEKASPFLLVASARVIAVLLRYGHAYPACRIHYLLNIFGVWPIQHQRFSGRFRPNRSACVPSLGLPQAANLSFKDL